MRDFTTYDRVMARQAASVRRAELVARHAGAVAARRGRSRWMRFGVSRGAGGGDAPGLLLGVRLASPG